MQKRSLIRLMMIVTLATASILVIAAVRPRPHSNRAEDKEDCPGSMEKCDRNKTQGEFIIWESLSRTILASTR